MATKNRYQLHTLVFLLLTSTSSHAQSTEQIRDQDAHEHGHAVLDVVKEGNDLLISLEVPSVNVVGFEHLPNTEEQHRAVEEARMTFGDAGKLFLPSPQAGCVVTSANVDFAGDDHAHSLEHESSEQHAEEESESGDAHSELAAEYRFRCSFPNELNQLGVEVFDYLLFAETIRVSVITNNNQKALDLHPGGEKTLSLVQ